MKKACTLKIALQLRDLTDYAPLRDNNTRWSSTYNMMKRFLKIKTELSAIVELLALFPNHLEVYILSRACETMKKFDSVTTMLQCDGMTFESKEIFDLFVKDYPDFKHYIADDAAIVDDVVFKRAIMKIARVLPLSEEERIAGLRLLQPDDPNVQGDEDVSFSREHAEDQLQVEESYSQALERKLKRQRRITES
jgi:hypothetical protein